MAVAFVSAGAGNRATGSSASLSTSWSHTISTSGPDTVVLIGIVQSITTDGTPNYPLVTYGGRTATRVGIVNPSAATTSRASVNIMAVWNPPTGTQTVTVTGGGTLTKTAIAGISVAYSGVSRLGTPVTATTTSVSVSTASANSMVFSAHSNGVSLTGVSGTNRYGAGSAVGGVGDYIRVQDAAGTGGSVSMSATGTATSAGSVGVELLSYAAAGGGQLVLRDAASSIFQTGTSTTTLSWDHTCAPGAALLVGTYRTGAAVAPTSVTYNGASMSSLGAANGVSLYGLVTPASGTNTVTVTYAGSSVTNGGMAASYTGVSSFGTVVTDTSSGISGLSVAPPSGGLAFALLKGASSTAYAACPRDIVAWEQEAYLSDSPGTGSGISYAQAGISTGIAVPITGTAPIPEGTASGDYSWASTATGKKPSKGTGSGSYTWGGGATGKSIRNATGSGVYLWTGSAEGKRTPKATTSGGYTWDTGSVGDAEYRGQGAGNYAWTGGAVGVTPVEVPTGTGAYGWVGTSTGYSARRGTVDANYTWAGAASGKRSPKGNAGTSVYTWSGAAAGSRPARANAGGSYQVDLVEAIGYRSGSAFATATYKWVSLASGLFVPKPATGVVGWYAE